MIKYKPSFTLVKRAVIVLFVIASCQPKKVQNKLPQNSLRIRKEIELVEPRAGTSFSVDSEITFTLSSRNQTKIDSIKIEDASTIETVYLNTFKWKSKTTRTGVPQITLTAYFNGVAEKLYPKITLLSDIVPDRYTFKLLNTFPHNDKNYTQGLFFEKGTLYESTGQKGNSTIGQYDFKSGEAKKISNLDKKYFGEGATSWNDKIYQITWESQIAFAYDLELNRLQTFNYSGEGWGLATWGDTLVMSDGTENIYLLNPQDFSQIDQLETYDQERKLNFLNELEIIGNDLYANIYTMTEDKIVIIDLMSGRLKGIIDLTGLIDRSKYSGIDHVLNGIAFSGGHLFVTAKWHPEIYEIELSKMK
jgi:glutaminyl-peptide cyclotransferase